MSDSVRAFTILDAIRDERLFGKAFKDEATWRAWFVFLAALFGIAMSAEQAEVFRACTGRSGLPDRPFREAWLVCGRRSGKSFVMALIAVFLACFRDYRPFLAAGERATIMVVAADRRQARQVLRFVSSTPDQAIIEAIRPAMLTIPDSLLICASSPYARRGALWDSYRKYFGNDDAPVLVWRAPTLRMNPSVPQAVIDEAFEADPASGRLSMGRSLGLTLRRLSAARRLRPALRLGFASGRRFSTNIIRRLSIRAVVPPTP